MICGMRDFAQISASGGWEPSANEICSELWSFDMAGPQPDVLRVHFGAELPFELWHTVRLKRVLARQHGLGFLPLPNLAGTERTL